MNEISEVEIEAILEVSPLAGAYLMERIGKTNMADMDRNEWLSFLEYVVMSYANEMAKRHKPHAVLRSGDDPISEDEVPF